MKALSLLARLVAALLSIAAVCGIYAIVLSRGSILP